ncbi:MAG: DNA repair protein RadA, partial [Deltaproteobacteria bacterium]
MTKKNRSVHVCRECGFQTLKWLGRCPGCGRWNTMVEEASPPPGIREEASSMTEPMPVQEIPMEPVMRLRSGLEEFDRTLGGGLVPGSLVLIGGDPGIGKSTLVLQVLHRLALEGHVALYLSGEESPQQIKLRADRLGVAAENLFIVAGTCLEEFLQRLETLGPALAAVDSIQTLYTQSLASAPGSVGQVREVASRLMMLAKKSGVPVFIIGHVTKEGAIAGPKVLEHMVDTVLYFEGEGGHAFRVLRAVKNRFGPTNEIGVFEMKDSGLEPVGNPSKL